MSPHRDDPIGVERLDAPKTTQSCLYVDKTWQSRGPLDYRVFPAKTFWAWLLYSHWKMVAFLEVRNTPCLCPTLHSVCPGT